MQGLFDVFEWRYLKIASPLSVSNGVPVTARYREWHWVHHALIWPLKVAGRPFGASLTVPVVPFHGTFRWR